MTEDNKRIHCPTNGKQRTLVSSAGPVTMTFASDGDGGGSWYGHVNGGELKVTPGTFDDHVAVMAMAIDAVLLNGEQAGPVLEMSVGDLDAVAREFDPSCIMAVYTKAEPVKTKTRKAKTKK